MKLGVNTPLEEIMKDNKNPLNLTRPFRTNWLYEVEPYSRTEPQTVEDARENQRLKKLLKRAVERDVAPFSLIQSIRSGIRA